MLSFLTEDVTEHIGGSLIRTSLAKWNMLRSIDQLCVGIRPVRNRDGQEEWKAGQRDEGVWGHDALCPRRLATAQHRQPQKASEFAQTQPDSSSLALQIGASEPQTWMAPKLHKPNPLSHTRVPIQTQLLGYQVVHPTTLGVPKPAHASTETQCEGY